MCCAARKEKTTAHTLELIRRAYDFHALERGQMVVKTCFVSWSNTFRCLRKFWNLGYILQLRSQEPSPATFDHDDDTLWRQQCQQAVEAFQRPGLATVLDALKKHRTLASRSFLPPIQLFKQPLWQVWKKDALMCWWKTIFCFPRGKWNNILFPKCVYRCLFNLCIKHVSKIMCIYIYTINGFLKLLDFFFHDEVTDTA